MSHVILDGAEFQIAVPGDRDAVTKTFGDERYFAEYLSSTRLKRGDVYLARKGEDLLGTVTLGPFERYDQRLRKVFPRPGTRLLTHLEVPVGLRNQSIGTWIMRRAEEQLRHDGIVCVVLGVAEDNIGAIKLYEGLKYRLWRTQPWKTKERVYGEDGQTSWLVDDQCLIYYKFLMPKFGRVSRGVQFDRKRSGRTAPPAKRGARQHRTQLPEVQWHRPEPATVGEASSASGENSTGMLAATAR